MSGTNPLDTYNAHIAALLLALDPNAHLWAELLKSGRQKNIEFAIEDKLGTYRDHFTGGFVFSEEDKALVGTAAWAMGAADRLPVISALTDGTGAARLEKLKARQEWVAVEKAKLSTDSSAIVGEKFKVMRARRTGEKRVAQNAAGEVLLNDKGEPRITHVRDRVKNEGQMGVACEVIPSDHGGSDVLLRFEDGTHYYYEITRLRHIPA